TVPCVVGVALLAGECRNIPVILDIDDLDTQLSPKPAPSLEQALLELRDPAATIYLRILGKATAAAAVVTVASTRLRLVAPGDVSDLSKALGSLLENPAEAQALGQRARAWCLQNYTMQHVAAALASACSKAIGRPIAFA